MRFDLGLVDCWIKKPRYFFVDMISPVSCLFRIAAEVTAKAVFGGRKLIAILSASLGRFLSSSLHVHTEEYEQRYEQSHIALWRIV